MSRDSGYRNPDFSPLLGNVEQNNDWQFEHPLVAVDLDTGEVLQNNLFKEEETVGNRRNHGERVAEIRALLPEDKLEELLPNKSRKEICEEYGLEKYELTNLINYYRKNKAEAEKAEPEPAPITPSEEEPEPDTEPECYCKTGCDGCMELWETIAQVTQLQDERESLVQAFNKLGNMFREHTEDVSEIKEIKGQAVEIIVRVS